MSMMKVLAKDGKRYKFGRYLDGEANPLRLNLGGLVYDEERGLVSLIVA